MKSFTAAFVASAVVAMISIDSVNAYEKYLQAIPNGSSFAKSLGHSASGYTDFGTAFSKAGSWTKVFCQAKYPGTDMTNGAAFGDPCCTWTAGGTPDKTVTAWTDKPTTATVCASAAAATTAPSSGSSATPSPAATTAAPSSGSSSSPSSGSSSSPSPATTTAAPSSGSSSSPSTAAPAAKTTTPSSASPSSGSKGNLRKCKVKEEKSADSDDSDDDDN